MSAILMTLGIVVGAAGLTTIGFGIPINEFTLGTTLIIAGTTALTGGLLLIGISALISEFRRLAEAIGARAFRSGVHAGESAEAMTSAPVAAPAAPPAAVIHSTLSPPPNIVAVPARTRPEASVKDIRPAEPYQAGPSAVEVSAAAIERLRSSIPRSERPRNESVVTAHEEVPLSPNGGAHPQSAPRRSPQPRPPSVEPTPVDQEPPAEDRAGGTAVEALKASRLDFLFRSKQPRAAPQPESFDTFWPSDARPGSTATTEPQSRPDQITRRTEAPQAQDHQNAASDEPRAPAILKSGVVDGMAYTLYADGSIEAKLPQGTVRFGSIAELRTHIESNS